jgi:hypothetical protein
MTRIEDLDIFIGIGASADEHGLLPSRRTVTEKTVDMPDDLSKELPMRIKFSSPARQGRRFAG